MPTITPILAFSDNYIWCIELANQQCMIVDPGQATPVLRVLSERALELTAILITHHHFDHVGGVADILRYKKVPVYGPEGNINTLTHPVSDKSLLSFPTQGIQFKVFAIPGHTLDHVAYYGCGAVFCGDTLFTAGCGKIFEGTPKQMYQSLTTLAELPDDTLIYCGHEYTENNLKFATTVEPNNPDICSRIQDTQQKRQSNQPTVPATLSLEKKTNPFLRCQQATVIQAACHYAERELNNPVDVLLTLREWKNNFI
jgi:hydroxyacylglutathione hydrolase